LERGSGLKESNLLLRLSPIPDESCSFYHKENQMDNTIIDLNATPFIEYNETVVSHREGGLWNFNPEELNFVEVDRKVDTIARLANMPGENANLLYWFFKNQKQIPSAMTGYGKTWYFPGTIYNYWNKPFWAMGNTVGSPEPFIWGMRRFGWDWIMERHWFDNYLNDNHHHILVTRATTGMR
jgi:hypothetical protein